MLSKEENELITRVGPGTPMGNLMRQYWLPFALSNELPGPDSDPVRILLLAEKLIAFRDTNGNVGLIQNHCPHRGASLFFGRNEEAGLRCVYHGWKFDVTGQCIDMPNEPAESNFKNKVKARAYPCQERGGVIWTYMGPRSTPPPLPDLEANMREDSAEGVRATQQEANWLQVLEGDIDTVHAGILHYGALKAEDQPAETFSDYQLRERHATFQAIDTDGGCTYGAQRPGPEGQDYWRIAQFIMPVYAMAPPGVLGLKQSAICRVPMDDQHTISFNMNAGPSRRNRVVRADTVNAFATLPNTTDWYGRFHTVSNASNGFNLDREAQRKNEGVSGWTGIPGIGIQDQAMTWSMGPVYDRSNEHLGTTDTMVIQVRRRLIRAARALAEHGITPPGVDNPEHYHVRSGGVFLPKRANWVEATKDLRQGFVEHPELDASLNGPL